jgi:tight adherence protein B
MTSIALLAAGAAVAGVLGAWEALVALERTAPRTLMVRWWEPLRRVLQEGRDPTDLERRRLATVTAAVLLASGWLSAGPVGGLAAGLAGPGVALVGLRARRRHYAAQLSAGAAEAARALADVVAAGHSARGAIVVAAPGLSGATGRELRAAAGLLALGEPTEVVLERLRRRADCAAWDALVAAILLQRDAGGDLVSLLRRLSGSLEAAARLDADARTATAQARFTAWLVAGLPLAAAVLGELASPGLIASLLSDPLSRMLTITAFALQLIAIVCIRRVARPRERA